MGSPLPALALNRLKLVAVFSAAALGCASSEGSALAPPPAPVASRPPPAPARRLDLKTPADNLQAFIKTRGSLDGSDVVYWWTGSIHSLVPGERGRELFQFEGFNVGRTVKTEGGWLFLSREAAFYKSPETGEILSRWTNFDNKEVEVLHVWNDPVNSKWLLSSKSGDFGVPFDDVGDEVYFRVEVFLKYPSPLPRSRFPRYSQADDYQAAELFQFFTRRRDLEDDSLATVPARLSWTRIGPFLPWMEMGDRPGQLVYHTYGKKLPGGYSELPPRIRAEVEAKRPEYKTAPTEYKEPNQTTWRAFRSILQQRGEAPREP